MALWLKLLADGLLGDAPTLVTVAAAGLAVSAALTWVLRVVSDRTQRRFRDRVTIALESHVAELQASVATVEHHEASGLPGSPVHPAGPGVRARSHVHVALHDLRLGAAPRGDHRSAGVDSSGARAPGRVRAAHGAHLVVAPGGGAGGGRGRRAVAAARPAPVRHRHDRAARQGSPGRGDRPAPDRGSTSGLGGLVRPRRVGPVDERGLAHGGLGGVRCGLCRRRRLRRLRHRIDARRSAPGARGGIAPVRVHRRHGGRDRLPARHLDGRFEAHGMARGLCGGEDRARKAPAPGDARRGHRVRGRLLRLPGHDGLRPQGHQPRVAGRWRGRPGRRERRRQDDAGEAPGQDVRTHRGPHPRRRHGPGGDACPRVAGSPRRSLPGLLPLRVPRAADGGRRRRGAHGRRTGRRDRRWNGRGRRMSSRRSRPAWRRNSGRPGPRAWK